MNEKTRMILNESLLIWAFGCAVDHYGAAALAISAFSIGYTVYTYGWENVKDHLVMTLIAADLSLILARMSGVTLIIPSAGLVIAANSFFAVMTGTNSQELMDGAVRWFLGILLVYTGLAFLIPGAGFEFGQLLMLILLIFAPVLLVYAVRVLADEPSGAYHKGIPHDVK